MLFQFRYTLYERDALGTRSKNPIPGWNSSRWDHGMIQAIESTSGKKLSDGDLREITPNYWEFDFYRWGIAIDNPHLTLIMERDTDQDKPQEGVKSAKPPIFK